MKSGRPAWLSKKIDFRLMHETEHRLRGLALHTVCRQALCPNIAECFSRGTATFLIMGDVCTRGCAFCGVKQGTPSPLDSAEPGQVTEAVRRLKIRHVVITSVTRDDLRDGGSSVFAAVIRALREDDVSLSVEVLVPDFKGDEASLRVVIDAGPDVFGHNIETVPRLYAARGSCDYSRSLRVLEYAKQYARGMHTKSAIMLGLGEREDDVIGVLRDLRRVACDYLSIGQYLQPGRGSLPVQEYIAPKRFTRYKEKALGLGFLHVESGVYVRSSYKADCYE